MFLVVRFEGQLELPQVPEMIFADNLLRVQHEAGYGIEFNALDALRCVDAHHDHMKVAVAQAWKEARWFTSCYVYMSRLPSVHFTGF